MPKDSSPLIALKRFWIQDLGSDVYTLFEKDIFCQACKKVINADKKSTLVTHTGATYHKNNVRLWKSAGSARQIAISQSILNMPNKDAMHAELAEALISANIPWYKLENVKLKGFLEKYIGRGIPDESTLRKTYLTPLYENVLRQIISELGDNMFWLSIDETTDQLGRNIAIIVAGALKENSTPYLISCSALEQTNHSTIAFAVNRGLRRICVKSEEEIAERFAILTTDSVNYMKKAGKGLQLFYPKMIHVTCNAHALHLVAEEIRKQFPEVNQLISLVKKVFSKAPRRIELFKEMEPGLRLPPEPVITRWGTWLEAADYYSKYFEKIEGVISQFKPEDSQAIDLVQDLFLNSRQELISKLAFINAQYSFIPKYIKKLEDRNLSLEESISLLDKALDKLMEPKCEIAEKILAKFIFVLNKNNGLFQLREINEILKGKSINGILKSTPAIPDIGPAKLAAFKYCPITSVEVERAFSRFKSILTSCRLRFTEENFEKYIVCNVFYNIKENAE